MAPPVSPPFVYKNVLALNRSGATISSSDAGLVAVDRIVGVVTVPSMLRLWAKSALGWYRLEALLLIRSSSASPARVSTGAAPQTILRPGTERFSFERLFPQLRFIVRRLSPRPYHFAAHRLPLGLVQNTSLRYYYLLYTYVNTPFI
jgi:hypothetical protein